MKQMRVACFATSDTNHFISLFAVATGLLEIGARVRIWTDRKFSGQIMAAGIEFGDLFENGTIDDADPLSIPRPARIVAFSVRHCEAVARNVRDWQPDLVFFEGFALIGRMIAERISRPWILINSGHLPNGLAMRELIREEFPARISDECLHAVERLKNEFGHKDASPYSYISLPSPWMNIHLEPPEWLTSDFDGTPRQIECFGSHLSMLESPTDASSAVGPTYRIYAAFGTIVWRYWTAEALKVLEALADAVEQLPSTLLTIGLGGAAIDDDDARRLGRERVKILPHADQISELRSHDLFVTHNGLNSTHEAVMLKVPMMSCPFFGDQPDLARLCVDFGVSHRIADKVINANVALTREYFMDKISTVRAEREVMIENLSRVHKWQINAISRRKLMLESTLRRF